MVEIRGTVVPEGQEGLELMRDINVRTKEAYDEGVPVEEISSILMFMSCTILVYGDEAAEAAEPPEETEEDEEEKPEDCPQCGTSINDVTTMMGGKTEVQPCGCMVDFGDLPGWVEDPSED